MLYLLDEEFLNIKRHGDKRCRIVPATFKAFVKNSIEYKSIAIKYGEWKLN